MSKYVAYFRVSTARQGQSGLGLEAQQAAVLRFLPGDAVRVADYVEVESGRKSARPQLLAAIALAQREDAVLLVAKLDRLARSVAFLATLMESRVRFQAVDLPAADELPSTSSPPWLRRRRRLFLVVLAMRWLLRKRGDFPLARRLTSLTRPS